LRPRLAFLADLLSDVAGVARRRERPQRTRPTTDPEEQLSADEVKRRLDASRERLRREIPPRQG